MQRLPTFVIIGAQKSGTRWLRFNLGLHPDIFTPDGEPGFFSSKDRYEQGIGVYLQAFEGWNGEAHAGESTPAYMMLRNRPDVVAARIDETLPDVRLFAVLRNPVDRLYSAFIHHMRRGRIPVDADLLERIRTVRPESDELQLVAGSWYARSLTPYFERYGDRVQVILNDDIEGAATQVYRRALEHLACSRPDFLPESLEQVRFSGGAPKASAYREDGERKARPLTPDERASIYEHVDDDITQLEALISRDLSMWRVDAAVSSDQ